MALLWMTQNGDDNHLDTLTRMRMNDEYVFNNEFWIYMFLVLCIFMIGFIAGNVAHDSIFHSIEQLQSNIELK